jgi:hypothetical protein
VEWRFTKSKQWQEVFNDVGMMKYAIFKSLRFFSLIICLAYLTACASTGPVRALSGQPGVWVKPDSGETNYRIDVVLENTSEKIYWIKTNIRSPKDTSVCEKSFITESKTEYSLSCDTDTIEQGAYNIIITAFNDSNYSNLVYTESFYLDIYDRDIKTLDNIKESLLNQRNKQDNL